MWLFIIQQDCWGLLGMSLTLVNSVEDHGFISGVQFSGKLWVYKWEILFFSLRRYKTASGQYFLRSQSKVSGQYHTIVESPNS